jgi:hypothetical protein
MTPDDEPRSQYAALIWTTRLSPRTIVPIIVNQPGGTRCGTDRHDLIVLRGYRTPFRRVRIDSLLVMK